jgi:uncharacterized protein (TIGR03083 family)
MSSTADRVIAALRTEHDHLAGLVPGLSDDQLTGPSGASEWRVADVLSHLGSGSEIALAGYRSAIDGTPEPADGFNESVWDRWNALSPQDQAAGYLEHNEKLVATLEALTSEQRETLQIKLGFLPAPLPLAAIAGMRLNETTLHGWDIDVALDRAAVLPEDATQILAEQFSDALSFLAGFIGKADQLGKPAVVEIQGTTYGFVITPAEGVRLTNSVSEPTAAFTGSLESAIRLLAGRLKPEYTPNGVEVTGAVSLDDLRAVFPGY